MVLQLPCSDAVDIPNKYSLAFVNHLFRFYKENWRSMISGTIKQALRKAYCGICSTHPAIKLSVGAFVVWRLFRLLRSNWQERRTVFDGHDSIAFCAHCSPQLMSDRFMTLGNAYEKRFHVPASCGRCSWFWPWRGWKQVRMRIGNSQYQFMGTYCALRMHRERDIHCPAANQLDVPNEYRFAHRFMQLHAGTLGVLEEKRRFWYSYHTRSYCLASQWEEIDEGDAYTPDDAPPASPSSLLPPGQVSPIQKMRQLWQFVYDNKERLPQSTLINSSFTRALQLIKRLPIVTTTVHARLAALEIGTRIADIHFMSPPPGLDLVPVARSSALAVGPVTHAITIHNAQDRPSVVAVLEGRSLVKQSVFPSPDGTFADLFFNQQSQVAFRLKRFWRKFILECFTDEAIDRAYHKLYSRLQFKEIPMSKFSQDEIEKVRLELQTTVLPEQLGDRKANGKLESVMKSGKPGRIVCDNTLPLLAVNIVSTGIFQHILFDEEDGIFYKMSIKHRPREAVLDEFGKMMTDPWNDKGRIAHGHEPKVAETCCWEIDQTGMELHERCNRQGEGLLSYTYNALMRINRRVSNKVNAEFTELHEAKIIYDVKGGMRLRFRIKGEDVPSDKWFTAKFPDTYLDSGWALTSGVNFINELSGVYCSITENPEHLFARNGNTKKFRLQDGTFDWKFRSIPLFQTPEAPAPSSFEIYLRGVFEGDDGGGAASRCLADVRNGGPQGLIIREQENLGYSAKLKTIVQGRLEIIGAHFPVKNGFVCSDVPWIPAVQRYTSKLGVQTSVNITPSSSAARFLSLASMFAGRNEPLQRGFEQSAMRIIEQHGSDRQFWSETIRTDGYNEIDRAFGTGTHCSYTMSDVKAHYDRCAHRVHETSDTQIRMLNMSIAEDVDASAVTRDDYSKLCLFADECRKFSGDHEAAYSFLPACFR